MAYDVDCPRYGQPMGLDAFLVRQLGLSEAEYWLREAEREMCDCSGYAEENSDASIDKDVDGYVWSGSDEEEEEVENDGEEEKGEGEEEERGRVRGRGRR